MNGEQASKDLWLRLCHGVVRVWLLLNACAVSLLFVWAAGSALLLLMLWNLSPILGMLWYLQSRTSTSSHIKAMWLAAMGISATGTFPLFIALVAGPNVGSIIALHCMPMFQWLLMLVLLLVHQLYCGAEQKTKMKEDADVRLAGTDKRG